ncbi:MAG: multiheme c-type cytochrome [Deltaproteobacteria bacterium]|nr:multiheme c-type cytochrome [Deltaproteobacteria bacterium]
MGILAVGLVVAPQAVWPEPPGAPSAILLPSVTVLAAGDLLGEITPCGCVGKQLGGLPRRLTAVEQARKHTPGLVVVDLGNNFPPPTSQGRLKAALIQPLLARTRPAAVLPGPNELAYGLNALDKQLPYVASNNSLGKALRKDVTVRTPAGLLGIYGYLSPQAGFQQFAAGYRLEPADPRLLDDWKARSAAAKHQIRILLFRGSEEELALFTRSGFFHLILSGNPFTDELNQVTERKSAGVVWPQVPTKGQGFQQVRVTPGSPAVQASLLWLDDTLADHPAAKDPFNRYDTQVKAQFFARLNTQKNLEKNSPYAGAEACRACHPAQVEAWENSAHAQALAALSAVGKNFDGECLACHVAGWERGGFLSADLTPKLAGVQCENCHGPARAHAATPTTSGLKTAGSLNPPQQVCAQCHVGAHSPQFEFGAYWPKIAHPVSPPTSN